MFAVDIYLRRLNAYLKSSWRNRRRGYWLLAIALFSAYGAATATQPGRRIMSAMAAVLCVLAFVWFPSLGFDPQRTADEIRSSTLRQSILYFGSSCFIVAGNLRDGWSIQPSRVGSVFPWINYLVAAIGTVSAVFFGRRILHSWGSEDGETPTISNAASDVPIRSIPQASEHTYRPGDEVFISGKHSPVVAKEMSGMLEYYQGAALHTNGDPEAGRQVLVHLLDDDHLKSVQQDAHAVVLGYAIQTRDLEGLCPSAPWQRLVRIRMLDGEASGLSVWIDDSYLTTPPYNSDGLRAFPPLPPELMAGLAPDARYLAQLSEVPAGWGAVPTTTFIELLYQTLVMNGILHEASRREPERGLYELATERLSVQERLGVLERVANYAETSCRERGGGTVPMALLAFVHLDTDHHVVSSAALSAAALIGPGPEDPGAGSKLVLSQALQTEDLQRRAAILTGLVGLAEATALASLRRTWKDLGDGRNRMRLAAARLPIVAVADFLITWAEDALELGDEYEMAASLLALQNIAEVATGQASSPYAGRGILELERNYPAWAHPAEQVVQIGRAWTVQEFGQRIRPRLERLRANESQAPKVVPDLTRRWFPN